MPEADFDEDAWRDRLESFRREKESYLLTDPESPLADDADTIEGLQWYPLDPDYRVVARFQPVQSPETVTLSTTKGPSRKYDRVATFGFTLGGDHHVLTGYQTETEETLFVPFTDETNGNGSPRVGRYLDVDPGDAGIGDDVVLEFNLAQAPFTAYSEHYASTVPPEENHVSVEIRAGERTPS